MKSKILFILPSLGAGGAERVISFIAQNLDPHHFEVVLLVISNRSSNSYNLDGDLKVIYLNKSRVLSAIPHLFAAILKINPKIVVSCISHLNIVMALISLFFTKTKFIAREATVSGQRKESASFRGKLYSKFIKITYPNLDKIICQSLDMKNDLMSTFKIPETKIVIINNPITNDLNEKYPKKNIDYKLPLKYITVGRLVTVKGHLRLLRILSKIPFEFRYTIVGEGPMKTEIFDTIKQYGIDDKVNYISYTKDVTKYLIESDFFLQGSFVEGFPNAVLESCAVGTPVIAFNAPGGTKEIIENGVNGFMVDDENEFLEKLQEKHHWDDTEIKNSVYRKFDKKIILNQYTDLFYDVLK